MAVLALVVVAMVAVKRMRTDRPEVRMRREREIAIDNLKINRGIDQK